MERYFSAFLDRIQDAGGDINETAGDGFMAIFQESDAHGHAVRPSTPPSPCSTSPMRSTAKILSPRSRSTWGSTLVRAGRLDAVRRPRGARWTFTASGPVTNLAARLAGAAGAGQILVGPETVRRLGDRYRFEPIPGERLKNITEAIDLFRVTT